VARGNVLPVSWRRVDGETPGAREVALARGALLAVGISYLVLQLVLCPLDRAPRWDESVYLSQVTPGTTAVFFMASRARGITLLIAPITLSGGSIYAVRLFLAVASSVAATAAFGVWVPLVGIAAPVGALVFSTSWLALVGASDVMPNLWAAVLGVAAVGLVARRLEGGSRRSAVLAAAAISVMALFRPTEAAFVSAAVAAYVLLFRRGSWRVLVPIGIGLLAGWLPWVIEMSVRFGGPLSALRQAGREHYGIAQAGWNVRTNLAYLDGRLPGAAVPVVSVAAWGVFVAMAVVAVRARPGTDNKSTRGPGRTAALLCCFGAVAIAIEYLVFVQASAERFLLPTYAFGSLLVGIGVVSLLRVPGLARAAGAGVLALVVPWAVWQGAVAERGLNNSDRWYALLREAGLAVRHLADGRPCASLSKLGYPEFQLYSGCVSSGFADESAELSRADIDRVRRGVERAFVILRVRARRASPLGSLSPAVVGTRPKWFIYRLPPLG
jgi:hypothetical protein